MGWEDATKAAKKSGSGLFLQLQDGESAMITIIGEPTHFYSVFKDPKEYSTQVPGSNFRFKAQIVEIAEDKMQGKIWSQGAKAFKRLTYINSKMGGVKDKILLVAREGSGKDDTIYNIDVAGSLSPEQKEVIKTVKLPDMGRKDVSHDTPDDSEVPF